MARTTTRRRTASSGRIQMVSTPRLLHVFDQRLELEARAARLAILELLASRNVPPEIAMLAIADVAALNAVHTDLNNGQPNSLADRLDSFCQRAEATYKRSYPEMSARRAQARESLTRAVR